PPGTSPPSAPLFRSVPGGLSTPDTLVAALVSVATDPAKHQWTPRWAEEVERIARIHLIPALGTVTAKNFTKADAISILESMAAKDRKSTRLNSSHVK